MSDGVLLKKPEVPELDLERWDWDDSTPKQRAMIEAAHKWVYDTDFPLWLVLLGKPGTGKTHLARIAASIKGIPIKKWTRILDEIKNGDYGRYNEACDDRVAIIDDIGADCYLSDGSTSRFACQKLCTLLDRRIRKLTLVTSNFSLREFAEQFDERIASRLLRESMIISSFDVDDYCLKRAMETAQP